MKVYIVYLQRASSGGMFGGYYGPNVDTIATYATEKGAQDKLEDIKQNFLSQGPGFITEDFEDDFNNEHRKGFSYGHKMGSMSFEPGFYFYTATEVIQ